MLNIYEVNKRLKQRPPFQMIERVLETEENKTVGLKTVSANDPWFQGHFPGQPVLPGVLIIESCAQLCSLAVEGDGTDPDLLYMLLKVDRFKFVKPIIPGDVMIITVTRTSVGNGPLITFDAVVKVDDEVRAKGSMAFAAVPNGN